MGHRQVDLSAEGPTTVTVSGPPDRRQASGAEGARTHGEHRRAQEDSLAWLGAFLPVLGHELRTPLAPIRLSVELLDRRLGDDPTTLKARRVIREQADRMAAVIDHLCLATQASQGALRVRLEPARLADIVRRALLRCEPELAERRVVVDVPEAIELSADSTSLVHALYEILDNALRYTEDGDTIQITAACGAGGTMLEIRDSGVGIPAELVPWVLGPFVRGPRPCDRAGNGWGLGLTIASGIVRAHGGELTIASAGQGCGTQARLTLPAVCPAAAVV